MQQISTLTLKTWHRLPALALVLLASTALAKGPGTELTGDWVLNETRSAAVQPENVESRNWLPGGKLSTTISVGGVQVPTGNNRPEASTGPSSDPGILRCKRLEIATVGEELHMTYVDVGKERFRQGRWRGVKTRWDKRELKSRYESTSRKVAYLLELQTDDSLLVTVTINPRKASKRTYKQVFERRGQETPQPEASRAIEPEAEVEDDSKA